MHELSIVLSIVDQVQEEVFKLDAKTVKRIELEIGNLAGIEWQNFDFAWQPATHATLYISTYKTSQTVQVFLV